MQHLLFISIVIGLSILSILKTHTKRKTIAKNGIVGDQEAYALRLQPPMQQARIAFINLNVPFYQRLRFKRGKKGKIKAY